MSRILHTYTEPVVHQLSYDELIRRLESRIHDVMPDVCLGALSTKDVLVLTAKAGLSVRLRGDVMSWRPSTARFEFEFIEAKVPARKRAPVCKPASRKPAKPIHKWLSDEWKRHDAHTK